MRVEARSTVTRLRVGQRELSVLLRQVVKPSLNSREFQVLGGSLRTSLC